MRRPIGSLTILSVLVFCTCAARADDTGLVGSVVGLDINTTSADTYLVNHGRMFVKNSEGNVDEYRWGGVSCGSRVLTEAQVAALQRALNTKNMMITPRTMDGQGSAKCLVGFFLVEKKNLKLFP